MMMKLDFARINRLDAKAQRHRRELVKWLKAILAANDDFRSQLPPDWEGDLLNDACTGAKAFLQREGL